MKDHNPLFYVFLATLLLSFARALGARSVASFEARLPALWAFAVMFLLVSYASGEMAEK